MCCGRFLPMRSMQIHWEESTRMSDMPVPRKMFRPSRKLSKTKNNKLMNTLSPSSTGWAFFILRRRTCFQGACKIFISFAFYNTLGLTHMRATKILSGILMAFSLFSCSTNKTGSESVEGEGPKSHAIKLITLDPGHFHSALVQKSMYESVDSVVRVFAPEGNDIGEHLKRIDAYNQRAENPTRWKEEVYTGADYLEKLLAEKPGNVVVIAGNNKLKTEYINKSIEAGLNVFADKPMAINSESFELLKQAFAAA